MATDYLFKCRTNDAYVIKTLIELLHHTLKTACFQITPLGITLRMMDSNQKLLIDLKLDSDSFFGFFFSTKVENQCINIGINLNHFYRMLKSVKKRDSLIFFIEENNIHYLGIEIIPKDMNRKTISMITIQTLENLQIELPKKYNNSILVYSNEFSKMCKDMIPISSTLKIRATKHQIGFYSDVDAIFSREVLLPGDNDIMEKGEYIFEDIFETEHVSRILKISGLNDKINLIFEKNMPFHIFSKIGSLGTISLFIKSKKQIEDENNYI
jgi:proliferating cell nuclear antigen PCNA